MDPITIISMGLASIAAGIRRWLREKVMRQPAPNPLCAPPVHPMCRCTASVYPTGQCVVCKQVTPGTFRGAFLCPDCAYTQAQANRETQELTATVRKPPGVQ